MSQQTKKSANIALENYENLNAGCQAIGLGENGMDIVAIASIMSRVAYKNRNDELEFENEHLTSSYNSLAGRERAVLDANQVKLMTARNLDMTRRGQLNGHDWSFDDTLFQCKNASAVVSEFVHDGKKSIMVAFRGTDQLADFADYLSFKPHYEKFRPLIEAVKQYALDNDIHNIVSTGHSLGGAVAQEFMCEHKPEATEDPIASKIKGITFGSPGATGYGSDSRCLHVQHPSDLVTHIGKLWHEKSGVVVNLKLDPVLEKKATHKTLKFRMSEDQSTPKCVKLLDPKPPAPVDKESLVFKVAKMITHLSVAKVKRFTACVMSAFKFSPHRMGHYTDTVTSAMNSNFNEERYFKAGPKTREEMFPKDAEMRFVLNAQAIDADSPKVLKVGYEPAFKINLEKFQQHKGKSPTPG